MIRINLNGIPIEVDTKDDLETVMELLAKENGSANKPKKVLLGEREMAALKIIKDWHPETLHSGQLIELLPELGNSANASAVMSGLAEKGLIVRLTGHWGYRLADNINEFEIVLGRRLPKRNKTTENGTK